MIRERIHDLVDTAMWAPSGDNSQPWRFELHNDTLRVFVLPDKDNPLLNYRGSGTYIAHGALIENIMLASPAHGLSALLSILPDDRDPLLSAEIQFKEQGTAAADTLARFIRDRHTNRKPYSKTPIAAPALRAIRDSSRDGAVHVSFIEDHAQRKIAAAASALMEQIALETKPLRDVFLGDILWSESDNTAGKQGLYIKTMEVPPPAPFLLRQFSKGRFIAVANALGFPNMVRRVNAGLYASGPVLGLVSMKDESLASYIAVGRATERAWLTATMHGLAFQPVTGILFLGRRVMNESNDPVFSDRKNDIQQAYHSIINAFSLPDGVIPGMMFRIGHANPATARSCRAYPQFSVS